MELESLQTTQLCMIIYRHTPEQLLVTFHYVAIFTSEIITIHNIVIKIQV